MGNFTYLLQCADGTYYCGWTNNPKKRLAAHNAGAASKYTRTRLPVKLVFLQEFDTKQEAMSREACIKQMSRSEKQQLISSCSLDGFCDAAPSHIGSRTTKMKAALGRSTVYAPLQVYAAVLLFLTLFVAHSWLKPLFSCDIMVCIK